MAELADAQDLKSWVPRGACGLDSRPRHQIVSTIANSKNVAPIPKAVDRPGFFRSLTNSLEVRAQSNEEDDLRQRHHRRELDVVAGRAPDVGASSSDAPSLPETLEVQLEALSAV